MRHEQYDVSGMTCAACSSRVEKSVGALDGVSSVSVNLLRNSMVVDYDESVLGRDGIVEAVTKAGYGACPHEATAAKDAGEARTSPGEAARKEHLAMRRRLTWSIVFTVPLFYISMGHMMGWPLPAFFLGDGNALVYALTLFLLALAVTLINNKYYRTGFKSLVHGSPNMDSLIALGSGASMLYGIYALYKIGWGLGHGDMAMVSHFSHDLYFEGAGTILTLITLGKFFEARAKGRTTDAVNKLMDLAPRTATVLRDGREVVIPASDVVKGDIVMIKAGDGIPVDGVVIEGAGSVDESAVTGESIPVDKAAGDTVIGATVNRSGWMKVRAEKVGDETALAQIIRLVDEATLSKAPIAKLADKVSGVFVPVVIVIALVSALVWILAGQGFEQALTIAVSVLVVSCPCALGLATPTAIMVGTGRGASAGILIKSAEALEKAHDIKAVVLDKTGTITAGQPAVREVVTAKDVTVDHLFQVASSLERLSSHPLAMALVAEGVKRGITVLPVTAFEDVPGQGVRGQVDGRSCLAGNMKMLRSEGLEDQALEAEARRLASDGCTPLFFVEEGAVIGIIALADPVKSSSKEAVERLRSMGIRTIMLTGDNELTAKAVASQVGVDRVIAQVLPQDKEAEVRKLQEAGLVTAMVGDGINDAPALARADVGIAIGAGTDVAMESADIVLMKSDLMDVATAIELGKATIRNIKQNLFWAFFYNAICIPIAAGCLYPAFGLRMNPMVAALAMSFSSVFVVTNALRLRLFKVPQAADAGVQEQPGQDVIEREGAWEVLAPADGKDTTNGGNNMKKLSIDGMMCMNCVKHVTKALESVEGVNSVNVSLEEGSAVVSCSPSVTDEALRAAVTEEGYEVKAVEDVQ